VPIAVGGGGGGKNNIAKIAHIVYLLSLSLSLVIRTIIALFQNQIPGQRLRNELEGQQQS
jgi:hypothetical protein